AMLWSMKLSTTTRLRRQRQLRNPNKLQLIQTGQVPNDRRPKSQGGRRQSRRPKEIRGGARLGPLKLACPCVTWRRPTSDQSVRSDRRSHPVAQIRRRHRINIIAVSPSCNTDKWRRGNRLCSSSPTTPISQHKYTYSPK